VENISRMNREHLRAVLVKPKPIDSLGGAG
jgi:hypothetical protein